MKREKILKIMVVITFLLLLPCLSFARVMEPVVSTDWLEQNLSKVIVVDVRKVEEYKAGHIPGAVNVFYGTWAIKRGDLLNELPADDDLKDVLSSAGIEPGSLVVVVGKVDAPTDRVDSPRVAWTLRYAGVENVSLLSGGYNKWVNDKKPVSTDAVKPRSKAYKGKFYKEYLIKKNEVMSRLGKALFVDVREPDFYNGKKKFDFVARLGHIKGAVNLPTSVMYEKDATYKTTNELAAIATPSVGSDLSKEIIIYCDTGKFCTGWWFMLHELMGYKDVKVYDGSMMEWAKDPAAPVEP
jgi:thiosulfate/3-mercaptopyruvate sulfurtransferase